MQNLSLPANAAANGAPITVTATMNDTLGAGDFSRMLARELAGKTPEHEPGVDGSDAATAPTLADNGTLLPPSDQDATTTTLLALMPSIQLGEAVPDYLQQIPGEMLPAALSSQIAGETLSTALSSQIAGETLSTALSSQIAGEALSTALSSQIAGKVLSTTLSSQIAGEVLSTTLSSQIAGEALSSQAATELLVATPAGQTADEALLVALSNPTPGGVLLAASANPIPGGVALASLQTGVSAQRNLSQGTHPTKSASGLDSIDPESDKTANFAASDKFLPPIAADDKISRAVTQMLAQDSSGEMSSPQTGISSAVATASLTSNSSNIDHNHNPRLEARVGTPAWDGALAQKVTWMVTQQLQVAQLQLNPPNLGPMEVMLTVGNGPDPQTRIEFTSPHLVVREAIQAALPHLREMMENSGLSLGSATVSADSFQQQAQAGRQDHASPKQAENMPQTASGLAARSAATRVHTGLVDTFA